ncbi:uncharacterized protein BO97DRAFT_402686 [Aspergillus homomorphus CBS 101889]|uniref:Tr-type G domain-containing protein n=1 Tax=Aspergillus homomorphus (strain CBS 101889) TaxID=1450537 RepID=A0A395I8D1_ASPHC|nr:hypothetical protein BO97DRAFT_402686 [Aspergillus homomorphus CBS 101889]RAL16236.1 hypothetical protein BO97DRAFT_402686 [Aspergillus homomorphus CBS 101889]
MASVFTYDPDPPRVSSPWSTSGSSTPQVAATSNRVVPRTRSSTTLDRADPDLLSDYGIAKLEPEPQEGPTEYKLHLLLRPRRPFVAMSTGHLVGGSYHFRASLSNASPTPSSYEATARTPQARSTESRQQRLEHLTTQLLWRLQQSSPFHSSTTANLVLPVLPDATPHLGAPQKPARLLPGLEESQGALYEIGVADDGTFVGLTVDELEESLSTLQVMAASLGCKVEILRRVIVGKCEWVEDPGNANADAGKVHTESLWVAEALVSPDWEFYRVKSPKTGWEKEESSTSSNPQRRPSLDDSSKTEQIRISISGPSAAGKSSLLGTLTSSVLDNGRGTSRLGLLKHRHEISSGITSSVAHELIGYNVNGSSPDTFDVINYASGNIAAWDDIHAASEGGRLAFVSDLPGSIRYLKSTFRGIISWAPHYVFLCIPATCDDDTVAETANSPSEQSADLSQALSHVELCAKLEIPTVIVITKMDVASRTGLRKNLAQILSALKSSGKKPSMLSIPTVPVANLQHVGAKDTGEVRKLVASTESWHSTVPIVLTSAVDGSGIAKLHALLRCLPIPTRPPLRDVSLPKALAPPIAFETVFDVDEVFAIPPSKVHSLSGDERPKETHGIVLCGLVRYGAISAGDELIIGPVLSNAAAEHGAGTSPPKDRMERRSDAHLSTSSSRSRPPSGDFSSSFLHGSLPGKTPLAVQASWQRVRVVSVRNLRLPVQRLTRDQVGTIGIEPLALSPDDERPRLGKIRKGSVLVKLPPGAGPAPRRFHSGFVASFAASEFASPLSPPVLLGGHAIVYVANVRSTVRLTCMALAEDEVISRPPSPTEPEFFSFDGDTSDHERGRERGVHEVIKCSGSSEAGNIRITFLFVSSIEWVEVGSRVLLMPAASAALASAQGVGSPSGFEGFVGRVCDVVYPADTK